MNISKSLKTILLVSAFAISTPALADEGYYASAHVGGTFLQDGDNMGELLAIESEYDMGFNVGGTIGYKFHPALSIEGELNYRYNSADSLTVTNFPTDPSLNGASVGAGGHVSALSAMLNAKSSLSALQGRDDADGGLYVLGGIGFAQVNADIESSGIQIVDDSDVVFAYQAGIGYELPFRDDMSVDIGYRYFGTSDVSLDDAGGDSFDAEYQSHTIIVGVMKRF